MEHRNWRWVSLDDVDTHVTIWEAADKPRATDGQYYLPDSICLSVMHWSIFRKLYGIDIKPGQCLRVAFTAKVIEDGTP